MRLRHTVLGVAVLLGCAPAGKGAPEPSPVAPEVELVQLDSRPREERSYSALGLSGANKPNGMEQRLRQSVPPQTPSHVPRSLDGLTLWVADPATEGWLAFYRGPLELRPGSANAEFRAVLFGPGGARLWDLDLNRFLSRPTHLEIQDVRLHDGRLYFNEACQSYSREAGGECSALVRLDPRQGAVDWRTRPRVSNDVFILHEGYVIAGYGFTAEPDSLFVLRQATGEIVARAPLDSAHSYLEMVDDALAVVTRNRVYRFALRPR